MDCAVIQFQASPLHPRLTWCTTHPHLPKKPVEPADPPCGALTRAVCGRGRHKWCPGGLQGRRRRTAKWRLSILRSATDGSALRICKSGARRVALIAPRTRPQRRSRTGVATTSALHAAWLAGDKRAFGVGAVSGETHASTKGGKAAPAGPTFKAVKSSARADAKTACCRADPRTGRRCAHHPPPTP